MLLAVDQAPLDQKQLETMSARFHPVDISADVSGLPANEQRALALMVKASHLMDALFLRQAWAGNEALLMELLPDASPLGQARLQYFLINKGPWSRLDHNRAFLAGVAARSRAARTSIRPAPRRRKWRSGWPACSPDEHAQATGFFTTIRRTRRRRSRSHRALQPRIPGRARRGRARCCARPRRRRRSRR